MKNERGSPIPDLSPAVGLTQLHNAEKMLLPHDNKINVFIRKSPDGKRQQPRGIMKKESDDQSRSTLAGLESRLTPAFLQPLTGTFLVYEASLASAKWSPELSCL